MITYIVHHRPGETAMAPDVLDTTDPVSAIREYRKSHRFTRKDDKYLIFQGGEIVHHGTLEEAKEQAQRIERERLGVPNCDECDHLVSGIAEDCDGCEHLEEER